MDEKKTTSPEKKAALEAIREEFKGTDGPTQRTRLLEALKRLWAVSTYEARLYLDIYYPPARIMELRNDGYSIRTDWMTVTTEAGIDHRIGLYVLESGVPDALA
jgi:hypothetical protein